MPLDVRIGAAAIRVNVEPQFSSAGDIGTHQLRQAQIDTALHQHRCGCVFGGRRIGLEGNFGACATNRGTLKAKSSICVVGADWSFGRKMNAVLIVQRQPRDHKVCFHSRLVFQWTPQGCMQLRLPGHRPSLRGNVYRDQRRDGNCLCIENCIGVVITIQLNGPVPAGMRIDDVRIERKVRDMIRNIGLQFQSTNHLVANVQLRHLNHRLKLRVMQGATSAGVNTQRPLKLQVPCLHCLELVESDARRTQLCSIGLALGLILKAGVCGTRR